MDKGSLLVTWRSWYGSCPMFLRWGVKIAWRDMMIHTIHITIFDILSSRITEDPTANFNFRAHLSKANDDKFFRKGPGRTGQIFVYFAKKFIIICFRQVRPVNFRSAKFCQSLPNFKDAVVLPRSRTNFCQAWNLTDLLIYTPWFAGKYQSREFDLYF